MTMGTVLHFPIRRAIKEDVVSKKIGNICIFKYPLPCDDDVESWANSWFPGRNVLLGWDVVRNTLIWSFKNNKAMHVIEDVRIFDRKKNIIVPVVRVRCSSEYYPVANWKLNEEEEMVPRTTPVLMLTTYQDDFFKPCQKCTDIRT